MHQKKIIKKCYAQYCGPRYSLTNTPESFRKKMREKGSKGKSFQDKREACEWLVSEGVELNWKDVGYLKDAQRAKLKKDAALKRRKQDMEEKESLSIVETKVAVEKKRNLVPRPTRKASHVERDKFSHMPYETYQGMDAVIYVDGSYDKEYGRSYCGAVVLVGGKREFLFECRQGQIAERYSSLHSELYSLIMALTFCMNHKIASATVCYDLDQVKRWSEEIKPKENRDPILKFHKKCKKASRKMKLTFVKVKSHSGEPYHDLVDRILRKMRREVANICV